MMGNFRQKSADNKYLLNKKENFLTTSSSIGTTDHNGICPVEKCPSIFPICYQLSPSSHFQHLKIRSLLTSSSLLLVPSISWVKIFFGTLSFSILSRWPTQLILCPFIHFTAFSPLLWHKYKIHKCSVARTYNFLTIIFLPLALQPTVGFGLSNNVLPLFPIYHQLSPSSHSQHLKISFDFLFPSFPLSSPSSRPFQFLSEYLFVHSILLHSL